MSGYALWEIFGYWSHLGSAIVCAFLAVWVCRGDKPNAACRAACLALAVTAVWALITAVYTPLSLWARIAESLRNLGWMFLIYRLFESDGRHRTIRPVRPVLMVLALLEVAQPVLLAASGYLISVAGKPIFAFETTVVLHLLVVIGALLLTHNLYAGSSTSSQPDLRWPAAAIAAMWVVELNYYTVTYLANGVQVELAAIRGVALAIAAIPLAVGMSRATHDLRFMPSRDVTFQTLSLVVIGLYFLTMVVIARSLTWIGGDLAKLTQVAFLFIASVVALLWLPSQRLRRWLKVKTLKHLFQHRYDYRAEWLRLTGTISRTTSEISPLHERVVRALADITDSPGGLLLIPDSHGGMTLAARWKWQGGDVPAIAVDARCAGFFASTSFICNLDDIREGIDLRGEAEVMPEWLLKDPEAWGIIPLQHFERLTGLVILSRPPHVRKLDWEDFDLLRVVGQQLASYMAEYAGQEALNEASRFDEFNRRIAFVMHDIKNLASQLSLLARNAERHIEKPEFRTDMLTTLRNSADKLNTLLVRLGRYGSHGSDKLEPVALDACVARVAAQYEQTYPVLLGESAPCMVMAQREGLEQALVHLVQNAIDASRDRAPVSLHVRNEAGHGMVEIADMGEGMSAEFIRSGLFKPFVSSRQGGFGIGAFEARELIVMMRGRLDVESREGAGTRFFIRLPKADTDNSIETGEPGKTEVA
ncbi:XrtA/PEP-CTERM system histidine kinase PrsK [Caenibius sp. WL]|uniref:XrtA/PEP-CTERM system histidine kinase PrsK n=1 Tax=Caenibius sp. WL TaxID=2872646 RepID=UPI001C9A25CD|nr:XrtA/PEP-CTERM system histidine kinase PrsK [Caenibius sp. WL]QZP07246.1 PEP-CTERM system histidine kinase PrsK [Caenibius sp. WL]